MGDIQFWKDSILNETEEIRSILESIPTITNDLDRSVALEVADKKHRSCKSNLRSFKMEYRILPPNERNKYEREQDSFEQTISQLAAEIKNLRSDASRNQLFLGANNDASNLDAANDDPERAGDALLDDAGRIQDKTQQSLNKTQQMIQESKQTGMQTVEELQRQRDQINTIDTEVMRMEDNLTRADRLIKTFGKRMATDRLIQSFACINVLLIVGVVIYLIVKGGINNNTDEAAPESPVSGESATRFLRGAWS